MEAGDGASGTGKVGRNRRTQLNVGKGVGPGGGGGGVQSVLLCTLHSNPRAPACESHGAMPPIDKCSDDGLCQGHRGNRVYGRSPGLETKGSGFRRGFVTWATHFTSQLYFLSCKLLVISPALAPLWDGLEYINAIT